MMKCHFVSNSQPNWEIAWPMAMRFSWTFVLTFNGLIENRTCIYPATLCYIVMIKQLSLYQNCEIDGLAESGKQSCLGLFLQSLTKMVHNYCLSSRESRAYQTFW